MYISRAVDLKYDHVDSTGRLQVHYQENFSHKDLSDYEKVARQIILLSILFAYSLLDNFSTQTILVFCTRDWQ